MHGDMRPKETQIRIGVQVLKIQSNSIVSLDTKVYYSLQH